MDHNPPFFTFQKISWVVFVHIIVGLGNPGAEYDNTRHNVGFRVVDLLAARFRRQFRTKKNLYSYTKIAIDESPVVLIKPLTYMNGSGIAVKSACKAFKVIDLEKILVIFDDMNLPFGTIRMRPGGSHGGQKGLLSIITALESSDFPRLRIGIGDHFSDAVDFVLSPFQRDEAEALPFILEESARAAESFIKDGIELTMSRFNRYVLDK